MCSCSENGLFSEEGEESYDPDNKDDIFSGLSNRITDLRHRYSELKAKSKNSQIPTECPICFEAFDQEAPDSVI